MSNQWISAVLVWSVWGLVYVTSGSADDSQVAGSEAKQASPTNESAEETSSLLAKQIAAIASKHTEREKQFNDDLHSIAQERKQLTEAGYMRKVHEANQNYREYLRSAASELMALIKSNHSSPAVLEGIILLQGEMRYSLDVDPELVRIVLEDQISNPQMGRLCYQMRYNNNDNPTEMILKAAIEKHPLREVRGQATYALGEYYRQTARGDWPNRSPLTPEQKTTLLANAERQFTDVLKNFSDVKSPNGNERLSETATIGLIRVRNIPNLKIGNVAPEVNGEDLDGRSVKLNDYRGKVVVLVFWGSWCGPCMAMVPEEVALFERMKSKPFVLLGVNCGDSRDKAKQTAQAKQMEWTSLWDGGTADGPIQSAFNVLHWPTVYVLDSQGIIRFTEVQGKELDSAVDELLADVEETTLHYHREAKPNEQ